MAHQPDASRDLADIRSMMERSSKFLSLSGWEGILAGVYALFGAYLASSVFGFDPDSPMYEVDSETLSTLISLSLVILILALGTAIGFSWRKSAQLGQSSWNATSRQLVAGIAVSMVSGGILILILLSHGLLGLIAPLMLVFYGLALINAGRLTVQDVTALGLVQISLGLLAAMWIEHSVLLWALGFGVAHIVYGILMQLRYGR